MNARGIDPPSENAGLWSWMVSRLGSSGGRGSARQQPALARRTNKVNPPAAATAGRPGVFRRCMRDSSECGQRSSDPSIATDFPVGGSALLSGRGRRIDGGPALPLWRISQSRFSGSRDFRTGVVSGWRDGRRRVVWVRQDRRRVRADRTAGPSNVRMSAPVADGMKDSLSIGAAGVLDGLRRLSLDRILSSRRSNSPKRRSRLLRRCSSESIRAPTEFGWACGAPGGGSVSGL